MASKYIRELRAKLRAGHADIRCNFGNSTVPGTFTAEATHRDWPYPIAVVWWRWASCAGQIEIVNSFTMDILRRCGLRTYLNEQLLAASPEINEIISRGATKSGEAWMRATGYKKTPSGWVFKRRTPRQIARRSLRR